jgi:hypothetical protein
MFQTFAFTAGVLLCGVGYALYKKVIQMLKDIDEKYEGKLKTLVFEMEVKHQVSINQLLKDIDLKYELKVNHQESIQKLENVIEYNLEHTNTLAIDLNNKLRLLKNEVKEDLIVSSDKVKDELKEDLLDKIKEDLVLSEDKVKQDLLDKVKNELEIKDQENIQTLKTKEFENALDYCGVGFSYSMNRQFTLSQLKNSEVHNSLTGSPITILYDNNKRVDTLRLGMGSGSNNIFHCFNTTERMKQIDRSDFCVKCEHHYGENEKYCDIQGSGCQNNHTTCSKFIKCQLYDASIIEINNKKYLLSKSICSNIPYGGGTHDVVKRDIYNMKKALLFNYEPDFKPKLEDKTTTYKWYQVGSIDRITKEIIWEPK